MKFRTLVFILLYLINFETSFSAYHDVLPQGVRLFGMRQIFTNKIEGFYGSNSENQMYALNLDINADILSKVVELDQYMLKNIKKQNPEAYKDISAGKWDLEVQAKARIHGFGFAYGLPNNLMLTASIPYFHINVYMTANRIDNNNYAQVNQKLKETKDPTGVHFDITNLPDPNGPFLQNILVNGYHYAPMGDWEGNGFGDISLQLKKQLRESPKGGDAIGIGLSVPTGKVERPEVLQDVSFGKGYWIFSGEYGGTYYFNSFLGAESYIRGSIPTQAKEKKRLAEDYKFRLSSKEGEFIHRPGKRIDYSFLLSFQFNDWFKLSPQYIFIHRFRSKYRSQYPLANKVYETNTNMEVHKLKVNLELSSITPFLKKLFPLPFTVILSGEKIIKARNSPNIQMISLDTRVLF